MRVFLTVFVSVLLVFGTIMYRSNPVVNVQGITTTTSSSATTSISVLGLNSSATSQKTSVQGKNRITSTYTFDWAKLKSVNTINIRLETEITEPEFYKDIDQVLQETYSGDVINIHLSGYGGRVDSTLELIYNIQKSHAIVNMIVEAPVYSADAYLAVSGDTLTMNPNSVLMFHAPANSDGLMSSQIDCSTAEGFDRGHPQSEQCEADKAAQVKVDSNFIYSLPYLTTQEKYKILQGYEIYLFPTDITTRASHA